MRAGLRTSPGLSWNPVDRLWTCPARRIQQAGHSYSPVNQFIVVYTGRIKYKVELDHNYSPVINTGWAHFTVAIKCRRSHSLQCEFTALELRWKRKTVELWVYIQRGLLQMKQNNKRQTVLNYIFIEHQLDLTGWILHKMDIHRETKTRDTQFFVQRRILACSVSSAEQGPSQKGAPQARQCRATNFRSYRFCHGPTGGLLAGGPIILTLAWVIYFRGEKRTFKLPQILDHIGRLKFRRH